VIPGAKAIIWRTTVRMSSSLKVRVSFPLVRFPVSHVTGSVSAGRAFVPRGYVYQDGKGRQSLKRRFWGHHT